MSRPSAFWHPFANMADVAGNDLVAHQLGELGARDELWVLALGGATGGVPARGALGSIAPGRRTETRGPPL